MHWMRIISITSDISKSHGYHLQTSGLRTLNSRRSISFYPCENGGCTKKFGNSKIGVSRHLGSSITTQMAKIMVQHRRPSRSFWAKSVRSSFGRTIMGKAIWENSIETWLGENSKMGMSLCSSWKRIILFCVCGWHQIDWKKTKHWSDVENTQHRSWFGRTDIFPWSCMFRCTQRPCEVSKDILDTYRDMFESWISAGRTKKLPYSDNCRISAWFCDMEDHAKKCVERCFKLANKTIQQLYEYFLHVSMHPL